MSEDKDFYKTMYHEFWEHARHSETEMWKFTEIYIIVIGAILASVGGLGGNQEFMMIPLVLSAFGFAISILGLFVVYTLRIPFIRFTGMAELIGEKFGIEEPLTRFLRTSKDGITTDKKIGLSDLLGYFYCIMATGMCFTFTFLIGKSFEWSALYGIITLAAMLGIFHGSIKSKWNDVRDNLKIEKSKMDPFGGKKNGKTNK